MTDGTKPLLDRVMLALLLIQLKDMPQDQGADVLINAGWTNPEIAEIFGMTANAVALRRSRKKKKGK